jgi:hypothetical protein
VQARGTVVWVNNSRKQASTRHPEGFGLQFTELPAETEGLLRKFIDLSTKQDRSSSKIIYPKKFARH